ncbi:MAG: hypothetical protein ACF8XB_11875 [Planctomycetota bacterium JB042]
MTLTTLSLALVLPLAPSDLFVSSYNSDRVLRFDASSGASLPGPLAAPGAQSVRYGPDGHLYVCAEKIDQVLRYDGVTGAALGPFVFDDSNTPADETGGLDGPTAAVFGADGDLYVASFETDQVLRYDGTTGAFVGVFVAAGAGGLNGPDAGMTFHPDGTLLVPSFWSNRVLRFDPTSGAFLSEFAGPAIPQLLSRPRDIRFRSDGVAYVSGWGSNRINRYDVDGTYLGAFALTTRPTGLLLPPTTGTVLVTSDQTNDVKAFDAAGQTLPPLVAAGGNGINGGTFLELWPDPYVRLSRLSPGSAGAVNSLDVRGLTPSGAAFLLVGNATASFTLGACTDPIGVAAPIVLPLLVDAAGTSTIAGALPASVGGATLVLQVVEPGNCRMSNLVVQGV